jgi:hypothetical protein
MHIEGTAANVKEVVDDQGLVRGNDDDDGVLLHVVLQAK